MRCTRVIFFVIGILIFSSGAVPAKDRVKAGVLRLTSSAPVFVAQEKGFFGKEGLEVEMLFFKSAQPIAVALASGDVHIGATGLTAGLYNAVAGGLEAKIVADKGRIWPGYQLVGIMVSNRAWDQGVRSLKDLKGRRIGVTQIGSTFHYMLGNLLPKAGLALSDVTVTPLGGVKTMMDTVAADRIDAAFMVQPFCTVMEKKRMGHRILWAGDWMRYQIAGIFFSRSLLKNRVLSLKFLRAYIAGCRYYFDQCLKNKDGRRIRGPAYAEVLSIISKYTGATPERIAAALNYNDRNGKLDAEDIQRQIDWYHQNGLVHRPLEASRIVDGSIWEAAFNSMTP